MTVAHWAPRAILVTVGLAAWFWTQALRLARMRARPDA